MRVVRKFLSWAVAAFFVGVFVAGGLSGCKSSEQLAARVAIQYGVGKYIEKAGPGKAVARAEEISRVTGIITGLVENDAVTVDYLCAYVAEKVLVKLSPADRLAAGAIVDAAAEELQRRVGNGVLQGGQLVQVKEVLDWISEASAAYIPTGPES